MHTVAGAKLAADAARPAALQLVVGATVTGLGLGEAGAGVTFVLPPEPPPQADTSSAKPIAMPARV